MKRQVGIIGLGQAGGNIAKLLADKGFDVLCINTSKNDLNPLKLQDYLIYHIPQANGANQDRVLAQYYASQYLESIIAKVSDTMVDKSVVYLAFSTGGGTGSGMSTYLLPELQKRFPNMTFGAIIMLPSKIESLQSQVNTYDCYPELTSNSALGAVFTLDNDKLDKFMINKDFADSFEAMVNMASYETSLGNIDPSDLLGTMTTRGNTIITRFKFDPKQGSNSLVQQIINSWEQNIFVNMEDDKKIRKVTLLLPERIDEKQIINYFGKALPKLSIGYSDNEVVTVLSGLTFAQTRLDGIGDLLEENKMLVKDMRSAKSASKNKLVRKLDWLDDDDDEEETPAPQVRKPAHQRGFDLDSIRILEEDMRTGS